MIDRSLLRGAAIFAAWVLGPLGLFTALFSAGVVLAIVPLLFVGYLIYPHEWFVRQPGPTATPILSPSAATAVAIIQWTLVTVVFALTTRRLSASRQAWIAPFVVVGVGAVVILVASLLGITVHQALP